METVFANLEMFCFSENHKFFSKCGERRNGWLANPGSKKKYIKNVHKKGRTALLKTQCIITGGNSSKNMVLESTIQNFKMLLCEHHLTFASHAIVFFRFFSIQDMSCAMTTFLKWTWIKFGNLAEDVDHISWGCKTRIRGGVTHQVTRRIVSKINFKKNSVWNILGFYIHGLIFSSLLLFLFFSFQGQFFWSWVQN